MSRSEAEAILNRQVTADAIAAPHFELHDPREDLAALHLLAAWCHRFTPVAGLEEAEFPECLLLNITGAAHLFGGEEGMVRHVGQTLQQQQNLITRIAVADTIGAALAVVRFAAPPPAHVPGTIIPPGRHADVLQPFPIAALRLEEQVVDTLHDLDVRYISQLCALPRSTLPSRFGEDILRRLDQALGNLPELIIPEQPLQRCEEEWTFEYPVDERETIEFVLQELTTRMTTTLARQGQGLLRLEIDLISEDQQRCSFPVGLVRPSSAVDHITALIRTRMERLHVPRSIIQVLVQALASAPLEYRQETLFETGDCERQQREFELLLERIGSRLGENRVLAPRLHPDSQPELACRLQSALHPEHRTTRRTATDTESIHTDADSPGASCHRPLYLKTEPVEVQVLSVSDGSPNRMSWDGETHTIVRSWGPERIHTGWWRKRKIERDYYRVETGNGRRFWLFRNTLEGGWFLHGVFG